MNRFQKNRHRKDANHHAIAQRLEELGCSVRDCSQLGDNGPDLLVGLLGRDYQVEVKAEGKALEYVQLQWHQAWRGQFCTVMWTTEQAEAWVQQIRKRLFRD